MVEEVVYCFGDNEESLNKGLRVFREEFLSMLALLENLKIRPMIKEDKQAIMQILRDTPEFIPAEVVVAEEVLDNYLKDPSGSGYYVFVAELTLPPLLERQGIKVKGKGNQQSELVGYICYGPTPLTEGTWDIYWMAVNQKAKGKGIGSALLALAEGKIKEAGGRLILIETSSKPEYERTIKFHRSQGYEVVSQIPDFYALGDDKLTLQKRLNRGKA